MTLRRTAAGLAATALTSSFFIALAPTAAEAAAGADTVDRASAGCVTKAEYRRVKKGMTKAKVHRIFGTSGVRQDVVKKNGRTIETRSYTVCNSPYDAVGAAFASRKGSKPKLIGKAASWQM